MRKLRQEGSSSIEPEAEARGVARGLSRKPVREASTNPVGGRKIRCAIYTRKSSEEGLEQEFNSLDAQREACEAFIKSQRHEGWSVLPQLYDDGGYSGGTMERPALKRLLADIAARRIDAVVVYKVDRLTRSLSDFAKIVEAFDAQSVSFVSVTQAFNTTTSMGRLTLNVLLSFAQFEREVTGERIRDKIAASKKKGLWMGGQPSLGYDVKERKLVVNEAEAATVRRIFRRYLELGSVRALKATLDARRRRQQAARGCRWQPLWRQVVLARRALSDAAEPHLPRRDRPQGRRLSRRTCCRSLTKTSGRASSAVSKPTASTGETSETRARRIF